MMIKRPTVPGLSVAPRTPSPTPRPTFPSSPLPPGGCFPLPHPRERVTLSPSDRFNAFGLKRGLEQAVGGLGGMIRLGQAPKATVSVGLDGRATGPDGQPLVKVALSGGRTAYVDPNTNEFYVATKSGKFPFGAQEVRGPMALPKDLEFSNAHFSAADCQQLAKDAARGLVKFDPGRWTDLVKNDAFDATPVKAR